MVNKELLINVGGKNIKIFMEANFFDFSKTDQSAHKHAYTELHCIECGTFEYTVDKERIIADCGDLIAIPNGKFHMKRPLSNQEYRVCIFQADLYIPHFEKHKLSPEVLKGLLSSVDDYKASLSSVKLSSYLALICSHLFNTSKCTVQRIVDRRFLIFEFFCDCHLDLTLHSLSKILNLSEKQTEREVMKYTGRRFRNELAFRRIEAAKYLLETEKITMKEAAERVGYKSYSGFYKSFKLYGRGDGSITLPVCE